MRNSVIKVNNISKVYNIDRIGFTTLREELSKFKNNFSKKKIDNTKKIHNALSDVSFEVFKGERLGILGRNGAGKSTLLKIISRITAPTSGTIGINGKIATILQVGTGFHGELTGRENIYMNGAILSMKKSYIDKKINDIIEYSEIGKFIDTPVKRYSSGMFVKLAFAIVVSIDADIIIMDEVLAVGDAAFKKKCIDKINELSKNQGKTIIYVSHDMNTVRDICDRSIVLKDGKLVFDGDVDGGIKCYMS